jgi:hypothetical protein
MRIEFKIPIVPIIFTLFVYLVVTTFLIVYLFNELKSLQNLNLELINELRSVQVYLAEIKMQSALKTFEIIANPMLIYRNLLKYTVYSIAILIASLTIYYGYSYFFSEYIAVNPLFLLLKKANSVLT